jgi:dTDP-4-amino-4,6-dideoxygalactose transaminase
MDFIDLASQLQFMRSAIDKRIGTVLNHGQFILGPEVTELEQKLAEYVGVKHCITCANGTDALQIALMSQNIGQGDIVFTTSFSFFATAEVISLVGATPYFVDIDPKTYNVCPQSLASAIKDVKESKQGNPRAVIAVDLFGLPANYIDLETLCKANQLFLIEDAAQGFGGAINGQKAGSFGDIATTSFFPAKPLGCYGDGGAIFTNSEEIADLAKSIRVHGKGSHKYENIRIGLNSRLDTIQAAILLEKLEWFPKELEHRQTISKIYDTIDTSLILPFVPSSYYSSWAQFTVRVKSGQRQRWLDYMHQNSIPTAIYYPTPLNSQQAFRHCQSSQTSNSVEAAKSVFSLPMSGYLSLKDAESIVGKINEFS